MAIFQIGSFRSKLPPQSWSVPLRRQLWKRITHWETVMLLISTSGRWAHFIGASWSLTWAVTDHVSSRSSLIETRTLQALSAASSSEKESKALNYWRMWWQIWENFFQMLPANTFTSLWSIRMLVSFNHCHDHLWHWLFIHFRKWYNQQADRKTGCHVTRK